MPRAVRPLFAALAALVVAAALVGAGCGGDADGTRPLPADRARRAQALAVDPARGTVLVGTDRGLFRTTRAGALEPVGRERRGITGLAFAADGTLLASGQELERSTDGGRTWQAVRAREPTELRLLRAADHRLYGLDATTGTLVASRDGGRRWIVRSTPPGLSDLAVDPRAPASLAGSSGGAFWRSGDGGATWSRTSGPPGALAWSDSGRVIVASIDARLHESSDGGRSWTIVGRIPSPLVALAEHRGTVLGLLATGSVIATRDDGRRWRLVAQAT